MNNESVLSNTFANAGAEVIAFIVALIVTMELQEHYAWGWQTFIGVLFVAFFLGSFVITLGEVIFSDE